MSVKARHLPQVAAKYSAMCCPSHVKKIDKNLLPGCEGQQRSSAGTVQALLGQQLRNASQPQLATKRHCVSEYASGTQEALRPKDWEHLPTRMNLTPMTYEPDSDWLLSSCSASGTDAPSEPGPAAYWPPFGLSRPQQTRARTTRTPWAFRICVRLHLESL